MNWNLFLYVVIAVVIGFIIEVSIAKGFKNINKVSVGLRLALCLIVGGLAVKWIDKTIVQTILIIMAVLAVYLVARNNLSFKSDK